MYNFKPFISQTYFPRCKNLSESAFIVRLSASGVRRFRRTPSEKKPLPDPFKTLYCRYNCHKCEHCGELWPAHYLLPSERLIILSWNECLPAVTRRERTIDILNWAKIPREFGRLPMYMSQKLGAHCKRTRHRVSRIRSHK